MDRLIVMLELWRIKVIMLKMVVGMITDYFQDRIGVCRDNERE